MEANIQRWGNSSAIRLPKPILKTADITEADTVQIVARKNVIVIRKAAPEHLTFRERMQGFAGEYEPEEIVAVPVGEEVFW